MECVLTQEELQDRLIRWKDRLGLNHWDVMLRIRPGKKMGPGNAGEVIRTYSSLNAIINILCAEDWNDEGFLWPQDMEATLVHELLHLLLAGCDLTEPDSIHKALQEQAICQLTRALVALDRTSRGWTTRPDEAPAEGGS